MRGHANGSYVGRVLFSPWGSRAPTFLAGNKKGGEMGFTPSGSAKGKNEDRANGGLFCTRPLLSSQSAPSLLPFRSGFEAFSSFPWSFSTSLRSGISSTVLSGGSSSAFNSRNGSSLWMCVRNIGTDGRVTNEDRRWWLLHLECTPDITPGTFVSWLDCCGTHTTKKLIERDIWTIEQVAALDADTVDELKYREGCIKMDVVWEHARTIISPLRQRNVAGGVETALQSRVLELRKKRELEKEREKQLKARAALHQRREQLLQQKREAVEAKKEELRKKLQMKREQLAAEKRQSSSERSPSPPSTSL